MSSVIGHALVGATIYSLSKPTKEPLSATWLTLLVFAAIAPDLDYLLLWANEIRLRPRITHSIGLCLAFGLLLVGLRQLPALAASAPEATAILLTPLSHLLLDALVNDGGSPLLWPLLDRSFAFSVGVLPSAPKPSWPLAQMVANISIELGILLPTLATVWLLNNGCWRRLRVWLRIALAISLVGCLSWSILLQL